MEIIQWNDSYSVGIQRIDEQHKRLIKMINDLAKAMRFGEGKNVISKIIHEMSEYAVFHFSTEEELFEKFAYPDKEAHIAEHKKFTEKVKDFQKGYEEGRLLITVEVLRFLSDWLNNHILISDKKYAPFFAELNVS